MLNMSLYPIGPLFIAKWGPDIRGRKGHAPQWWPTSTYQLSQVRMRNRIWTNDDVIQWKHFPRYWPFVRGIRWIPHTKARDPELWFSLICAWINGWVNNSEAGDLRRHRAYYDVIVMQEFGQATDTSYVRSLFTIPLKFTTTLMRYIGSASGSRDCTRFGPGGSTLSRFPCKTPIGKVGTSQYTVVTKKLA